MRSRYRCSMCPAIHINSRSWLRSSSTHEPSDPPLRVVFAPYRAGSTITPGQLTDVLPQTLEAPERTNNSNGKTKVVRAAAWRWENCPRSSLNLAKMLPCVARADADRYPDDKISQSTTQFPSPRGRLHQEQHAGNTEL